MFVSWCSEHNIGSINAGRMREGGREGRKEGGREEGGEGGRKGRGKLR